MLVEAERKGKLWGGEGDTVGALTPHPGPLLVERRGRTFHAVGLLWRRWKITRFEQRMRANFLGGVVFLMTEMGETSNIQHRTLNIERGKRRALARRWESGAEAPHSQKGARTTRTRAITRRAESLP